ncbi:MAG: zf-HC2 domain-containing protein [Planctomycetes bacterium]|nr:zf-HC2 domain-containing protein [Planctomycetota bacterium]
MNCARARSLFDAEMDRELSGAGRNRLLRHLDGCRTCAGEMRRLRRAMETLRKSSLVPPAADACARLHEDMRKESPALPEVLDLDGLADWLRLPARELEPFLDQIPAFEIAGRLRFRRSSVEKWIEERERAYAEGRRTRRMRLEAV